MWAASWLARYVKARANSLTYETADFCEITSVP